MFFTPRLESGESRAILLPFEIMLEIFSELDIKAAFCFSRVNTASDVLYRSEKFQKQLLSSHFMCPWDPAMDPREQYRDLFLSRIPSRMPNGLPLYKKGVNTSGDCGIEDFNEKLKISSSGTMAVLQDLEEEGLSVWNLNREESPKEIPNFIDCELRPNYFGIHPKGTQVCAGSLNGLLKIFNSKTGKLIKTIDMADKNYPILTSLQIKNWKALSTHSQTVRHRWEGECSCYEQPLDEISKLWDLETGGCIGTFDHTDAPLSWVQLLPNGTQFVSASISLNQEDFEPVSAESYDLSDCLQKPPMKSSCDKAPVEDHWILLDGWRVEGKEWKMQLFDFSTNKNTFLDLHMPFEPDHPRFKATVSGDCTKAFFCTKTFVECETNRLHFCDLKSGSLLHIYGKKTGFFQRPQLNFDGTRALDFQRDANKGLFWNPITGKSFPPLSLSGKFHSGLIIEPDGMRAICVTQRTDQYEIEDYIYETHPLYSIEMLDLNLFTSSFFVPQEYEERAWRNPFHLKSAGSNYLLWSDVDVEVWNASPQIYEQLDYIIMRWSDIPHPSREEWERAEYQHYKNQLFDRLPRKVRTFVEDFARENEGDKVAGLIAYFKRDCVPKIIELMERTILAKQNQTTTELTSHKDSIRKWIENCRLKEIPEWILQECLSQLEPEIFRPENLSKFSRLLPIIRCLDPDKAADLVAHFKKNWVPKIMELMESTILAQQNEEVRELTTDEDSIRKWIEGCQSEETPEWILQECLSQLDFAIFRSEDRFKFSRLLHIIRCFDSDLEGRLFPLLRGITKEWKSTKRDLIEQCRSQLKSLVKERKLPEILHTLQAIKAVDLNRYRKWYQSLIKKLPELGNTSLGHIPSKLEGESLTTLQKYQDRLKAAIQSVLDESEEHALHEMSTKRTLEAKAEASEAKRQRH